jgi:hypothetical protein
LKISGKFDVKLQPLETYTQGSSNIKLGRMSLDKIYSGKLTATSKGEMLSSSTSVKGSAGYVAIEQVIGTLEGRSGSFVLQHFGIMKKGETYLQIEIVPGSGTDELKGIFGKMSVRIEGGEHYYDLEYQFTKPG